MAVVGNQRVARLDRPAAVAAIAGLLALLVIAAMLVKTSGDASRLVHAGPPWTDAAQAPGSLTVRPADQAYDGQFFYRLGVSPFSTAREVSGVTFDLPALRNARWLSGALAWVLSAGQPGAVPWTLLLVNLLSAIGLGAAAGALAKSSGRHALWGLLLVGYPGYAFTLTLDTSELLAGAMVLGGLYACRRSRWTVAAVAFALAVLARDTAVAIPAGVALGGLIEWGRGRRPAWQPFASGAVGVVVFGAWQVVQRIRFDAWPFAQSRKNNLSGPFAGLVEQLRDDLPPHGGAAAFRLVSLVVLLGVIVLAGVALRRSTTPFVEKVAWLPATFVVVTLNAFLWSGATAFMRAGTESYLMSVLVLLGHRSRYALYAAPPVALLWVLTVGSQLSKG